MSFLRARRPMLVAALLGLSLAAAGCDLGGSGHTAGGLQPDAVRVHPRHRRRAGRRAGRRRSRPTSPRGATDVPVDHRVQVSADERPPHLGRRQLARSGSVAGKMSRRRTVVDRRRPARAQHVVHRGELGRVRRGGKTVTRTTHFRTAPLTLDQQTYPSIAPLSGQTVGVGMPVIVKFDVPVTDRASIEKNLHVVSQPAQKGSWHWLSDNEVHWRPVHYWKAGTTSRSTPTSTASRPGNGIYGQLDRSTTFHIGDAHVYKVNIQTDQLQRLRQRPPAADDPGHDRHARVHDPLRHQGDHREGPLPHDELRDHRHRPEQRATATTSRTSSTRCG